MPHATAITIGNFDGAHLGHLTLVREARSAVGDDGRVVVLSFDPHPLSVLKPGAALGRLSTFPQRSEWLRQAGADEVIAIEPSGGFLALTPEQFLEQIVTDHQPSVVVEGPDFRFGSGRSGSVETLREAGGRMGFDARIVDPVEASLQSQFLVTISSSLIRWLVRRGRVRDARRLLGRPLELRAEVVPGDRRGRTIDMPTANLDHRDYQLPADGIYAGRATDSQGRWHTAAISIGTKPTFGDHARTCEAHLIGWPGGLDEYHWPITIHLHDWIRDQIAFEGVDGLLRQMARDLDKCVEAISLETPSLQTPDQDPMTSTLTT